MTSVLVVIRDDLKPSPKASFVAQLFRSSSNTSFFYVFKKEKEKFREEWSYNQVELATSVSGILAYYLLLILKSPRDLRDGALRRLLHRDIRQVLVHEGFLSTISQTLNQYFTKSGRTDRLIQLLRKLNSRKIFLIDEFISINFVNSKMLKKFGSIIYVSQDVAYNHFSFADNFFAKRLMYKLERDMVSLADIVIACSEMERQIYLEMGAKKVVFYPNIYPIQGFKPNSKDETPSISIVLPGHWGAGTERSLNEVFDTLSHIKMNIKVYMIGIKPKVIPRNIKMEYYKIIPRKIDYLKILSKSWIGINLGIHLGGTNQKKYDYAMAELVVVSDKLGVRGDLLPHEYAYADNHDLIAKLEQLLEFGKEKIVEMGIQNRVQALSIAEKQQDKLLSAVKTFEFNPNKKDQLASK